MRCETQMADASRTNYALHALGLFWQKGARVGRSDRTEAGMGPHLMDVVVEGKRYRTAAATLLASGPAWDARLGDEPRRLLEVRVGGVDLSAVVGGGGWERLCWEGFLFPTTNGKHLVQGQNT